MTNFVKIMEPELQIVELKTTYGPKGYCFEYAFLYISLKNIERPLPGDVINRGKILKKRAKY